MSVSILGRLVTVFSCINTVTVFGLIKKHTKNKKILLPLLPKAFTLEWAWKQHKYTTNWNTKNTREFMVEEGGASESN